MKRMHSDYVVIAEFEVMPARWDEFLALARGFAADCLRLETGCRQFDAVVLEGTPPSLLFYETCDDLAAFEAHGRAAHLAVFKEALEPLVIGQRAPRKGQRAAV